MLFLRLLRTCARRGIGSTGGFEGRCRAALKSRILDWTATFQQLNRIFRIFGAGRFRLPLGQVIDSIADYFVRMHGDKLAFTALQSGQYPNLLQLRTELRGER
jgi:hypothetical protein